MHMRIITGAARGKKLQSLEGERVRPTPDRVKEALFNIIQFDLEGRRVLDLFAGSGQLGLEALSRGAQEAVFVDSSRDSAGVVERNISATGFGERAKVVNADFASFLSRNPQPFDIAFLDPPYRTGLLQQALPQTAAVMNHGGTIICEHPSDEELPLSAGDFVKVRSYRYGKILLTVYRHKDVTSL